MREFFRFATDRRTVAMSARVALVVGTVLALINYGDRIFLRYDMHAADWIKLALSYCVPYCVAAYGAARYAMKRAAGGPQAAPPSGQQ
jgi:hypothetical protein